MSSSADPSHDPSVNNEPGGAAFGADLSDADPTTLHGRGILAGVVRWSPVLVMLLVVCYALMVGYAVLYGGINEDEGWYLYAAESVSRGRLPYVDFAYTQGPMHAYVYGLVGCLWDWTLYRGRLLTGLVGAMSLWLAMGTARALAGHLAALLCGAAMATNAYLVYFLCIPKTYALAACLCIGAARVLVLELPLRRRAPMAAGLLMLAAGTRISFVSTLVILFAGLWLTREPESRRAFAMAVGVCVVVGAVLFLPYLIWDPEVTFHSLIGYHMARYSAEAGLVATLQTKFAVLRELRDRCGFLLVASALGLVVEFLRCVRSERRAPSTLLILQLMAGTVFLAHFLPGGSFAEYQVVLAPLLAALTGIAVVAVADRTGARRAVVALAVLGMVVQARYTLSFPWRTSDGQGIASTRSIARVIEDAVSADKQLLTAHTFLAVESGHRVPEGFELSLFSYFPDWSVERCRRFKVVNDELILRALASADTGAVFVMDNDFGVDAYTHPIAPERVSAFRATLERALKAHYVLAASFDDAGQFRDRGQLWLRETATAVDEAGATSPQ